MKVALIDSTPLTGRSKGNAYSIALLKIGAMLKSQGHDPELFVNRLPPAGVFEEAWITTLFTYHAQHAGGLIRGAKDRVNRVRVGGVAASLLPDYFRRLGADVHIGPIPEAETMIPDYSLLPEPPEYSVIHTSRGCVRKCKFCMVHKLEPEFKPIEDWETHLAPGAKRILFYDNNWLAKPISSIREDVAKIKALKAEGRIQSVDFNQANDVRLLTEKKADELVGVPFQPLRFAFDFIAYKDKFLRAVDLMVERGFKDFSYYTLYNFEDTPADFYERIKCSAILREENGATFASVPMKYHPIHEVGSRRDYIGKHWTRRLLGGFAHYLHGHSVTGQISPKGCSLYPPVKEFEFWFGATPDEFIRLLNFPRAHYLADHRKEKLSIARLAARTSRDRKNGNTAENAKNGASRSREIGEGA